MSDARPRRFPATIGTAVMLAVLAVFYFTQIRTAGAPVTHTVHFAALPPGDEDLRTWMLGQEGVRDLVIERLGPGAIQLRYRYGGTGQPPRPTPERWRDWGYLVDGGDAEGS